jgi:hypothetical protein
VSVVAGGVKRGNNGDCIFPNDEDDPIPKASGENPPDFRATTQPQVDERIFNRAPDGRANLKGKLQTQAGVPDPHTRARRR